MKEKAYTKLIKAKWNKHKFYKLEKKKRGGGGGEKVMISSTINIYAPYFCSNSKLSRKLTEIETILRWQKHALRVLKGNLIVRQVGKDELLTHIVQIKIKYFSLLPADYLICGCMYTFCMKKLAIE